LAAEDPKDAAISRHLALSTVSNYLGQVVNLAVWFLLTPFLVRKLGASQYGLWVLVSSFIAYGSLLDFGVGDAIVKYVAEFRARGDGDSASRLVATSLWLYCALGLLVFVIGVALAPLVPKLINVPPGEQHTASLLVILTALGVAVELPATASYSVLRGLHRFDLMNIIGSSAILALAVGWVIVLLLGGGVLAMAAIVIPLTLVWQIPAIMLIRRTAPDMRFGFRGAERGMARSVATFSSALFGINVAAVVKGKSDEIVIGATLPVAAVAPYSIARRLSGLPGLLAFQFVRVLMPLASRLNAEGDRSLLSALYTASMRFTIGMFAAVAGGLIVFAGPFLSAWVGPRFAHSSNIVVILTFAGLAEALLWPAAQLLQGMNRHRPLVVFALGSAGLNLGLSIILIGPLGVKGVAYGTLIATGIEALIVVPFAGRVTGVAGRTVFRDVLVPSVLPAIPMVAVLVLIRATLAPSTIVTIAIAALAGTLVYAAGYLAFPVAVRERALARAVLGAVGGAGRRLVSR